jgi:hypothetical protein
MYHCLLSSAPPSHTKSPDSHHSKSGNADVSPSNVATIDVEGFEVLKPRSTKSSGEFLRRLVWNATTVINSLGRKLSSASCLAVGTKMGMCTLRRWPPRLQADDHLKLDGLVLKVKAGDLIQRKSSILADHRLCPVLLSSRPAYRELKTAPTLLA